jgi:hypothetical protein
MMRGPGWFLAAAADRRAAIVPRSRYSLMSLRGATSALPMTATSTAPMATRIVVNTVGLLVSVEPVQLALTRRMPRKLHRTPPRRL